jgi:hypothetical protein
MIAAVGGSLKPATSRHISEVDRALDLLSISTLSQQQLCKLGEIHKAAVTNKVACGVGVQTASGFEVNLSCGTLSVVTPGVYGTYNLVLGLRGVVGGNTQAAAEVLCREINEVAAALPHFPLGWKVELSGNNDLPSVNGDMTVSITPLLQDSTLREPSSERVIQGEIRCSQMELLKQYDLVQVENDLLRLAVGLFQVGVGFSPDRFLIGRGDFGPGVLEGKIVRTKPGSGSYAVMIDHRGVRSPRWGAQVACLRYAGVAGRKRFREEE